MMKITFLFWVNYDFKKLKREPAAFLKQTKLAFAKQTTSIM